MLCVRGLCVLCVLLFSFSSLPLRDILLLLLVFAPHIVGKNDHTLPLVLYFRSYALGLLLPSASSIPLRSVLLVVLSILYVPLCLVVVVVVVVVVVGVVLMCSVLKEPSPPCPVESCKYDMGKSH